MDTQMNYYAALGEAEEKVSGSRKNLLMMIILTVVNLVLLALDSNAMMLFSATVPYYSVAIAMAMGIKELFIVAMIISVIYYIIIGIKYGRRLNQLKKQAPQNNEMNLDNIYSSNNSTDY